MVRFILIVLPFLCTFSSNTVSQTRMGFHGGTHVSALSRARNWDAEWNWLRRPTVGVSFDHVISEGLLAVVQIDLVQKWTSLNDTPFPESASYTVYHTSLRNEYLDIPFYVRWRPSNATVRWFAEAGPRLSILISSQAEMSVTHGEGWTRAVKEQISNPDIGVAVGSGLEIVVSKAIFLTFSAHYTHGLVPIFRESSNDSKLIGVHADCGVMFVL